VIGDQRDDRASRNVVEADTRAAPAVVYGDRTDALQSVSCAVGILGVEVRNARIFCPPEWTLKQLRPT
jgi:hypothetical protein